MINKVSAPAKFGNKNIIPKPLGCQKLLFCLCKFNNEVRRRWQGIALFLDALSNQETRIWQDKTRSNSVKYYLRLYFENYFLERTWTKTMRDPSMTIFPTSVKLTVIRLSIRDCTCPIPQSGCVGCFTNIPGSKKLFKLSNSQTPKIFYRQWNMILYISQH